MKEVRMCFSEVELSQKRWLSRENKQVLESKGVSQDQKKAGITRHTTGVGARILPRKATNLVF